MRLTGVDFLTVLKGRAAVVGPSHLPDARVPLHSLDPEAGMETLTALGKVSDELRDCGLEFPLLLWA